MHQTRAQFRKDDPTRLLTLTDPDDPTLLHLAIGESTYTILISGAQTAGRYSLIDMSVPADGGPPPHRHTFEEMFHVLEGELEVTIRGETVIARPGQTVNIPALAPHAFRNPADTTVRVLCLVAPAGLEDYFAKFGDPVASRTSPPPTLSDAELATRGERAGALAAQFGIELV
ncbi:MAG TPA: cupin domain-containing protein [Solirubrobacteraceae bacterium]|nr:cupin domain-containing protein [Solirubrobacteraceae bacterium]